MAEIGGTVAVERLPDRLRLHCVSSAGGLLDYVFEGELSADITHVVCRALEALGATWGCTLKRPAARDVFAGQVTGATTTGETKIPIVNDTGGVGVKTSGGGWRLTVTGAVGNSKRFVIELVDAR